MIKSVVLILIIAGAAVAQVMQPHRFGGEVVATGCDENQDKQYWNYIGQAFKTGDYCMDSSKTVAFGYKCTPNTTSQIWTMSGSNIVSNGKCLTVQYVHGAAFSNVVLGVCMPASSSLPTGLQSFDVRTTETGIKIVNKATSQCLALQTPDWPLDKYRDNPIVIGHRGSTFDAPENTMPAFQQALDYGADGFETDLRITKDNVCVLIHDDTVDRTSNCKGKVRDLTYAQLMQCDFGKWFDGKFVGTKIPTFEESVKLASSRNAYLVMDLKELGTQEEEVARANDMKRVLDLYNYHALAIASCRNENQMKWFNWLLNGTTIQHLENQPSNWNNRDFWKNQIQMHLNGFSLQQSTVTPDFIRTAHSRLISVFSWSPDSLTEQWNAIWYGFDGVITGDVKQMLELVRLYRERLTMLV